MWRGVQDSFAQVDARLRGAVDDGTVAGAVLACGSARGGRHTLSCGDAQLLPSARPVREDTLFDLASLTKVLATTWLCMKWWEEGRLDLDAPLGELLPGYYPRDKTGLSVRALMSHAAGLPSGLRLRQELGPQLDGSAAGRRRHVVARFLSTAAAAAPGAQTLYSDIGPILVGDLLEQLGSSRLDCLCEEELFGPAGLADTFYIHADEPLAKARRPPEDFAATEACPWRGRVLVGEVHDENACLLRGVAGHAGLFACGADVERIARAFLGIEGDPRIAPETLGLLTLPQQLVSGSRRAFGWDTAGPDGPGGSRLSRAAYGHTGFTGTSLWIDPQAGLYVVLLTNRVHPTRDNTRFLDFRPGFHDLVIDALARDG